MRKYIIIGAGVTGMAALESIRSIDAGGQVTLISDDPFQYYSRPALAYYLTGEVNEKQLFPKTKNDLAELNANWIQARVQAVDLAGHFVTLHESTHIHYDSLLLATGALAARINLPGIDLKGVVKLDNLQDAHSILENLRKSRRMVVVGGGITALELVEGACARGAEVHYLMRGDRYWKSVLDETEANIVEAKLQQNGVRIHHNTEIQSITGKNGRVQGVTISGGEVIACEMVALAIGVEPRKHLAQNAGLKVDRGVLVNEKLQTSHPDVYAAGDVAQVYDPHAGRAVLDTLWPVARQQGTIAGLNMAGQPRAYHKNTAYNITRLAGLYTTIIGNVGQGNDTDLVGIARGDSEAWRHSPDAIAVEKNFKFNRVRVMLDEDRILGAVVMGDQTLSRPLYELIEAQVDIKPIREALLRPGKAGEPDLAESILSIWTQWREKHAHQKL